VDELNKRMWLVLDQLTSLLDAMEAEGLGTEKEDVHSWPQWAQEQHEKIVRWQASLNRQISDKQNWNW